MQKVNNNNKKSKKNQSLKDAQIRIKETASKYVSLIKKCNANLR